MNVLAGDEVRLLLKQQLHHRDLAHLNGRVERSEVPISLQDVPLLLSDLDVALPLHVRGELQQQLAALLVPRPSGHVERSVVQRRVVLPWCCLINCRSRFQQVARALQGPEVRGIPKHLRPGLAAYGGAEVRGHTVTLHQQLQHVHVIRRQRCEGRVAHPELATGAGLFAIARPMDVPVVLQQQLHNGPVPGGDAELQWTAIVPLHVVQFELLLVAMVRIGTALQEAPQLRQAGHFALLEESQKGGAQVLIALLSAWRGLCAAVVRLTHRRRHLHTDWLCRHCSTHLLWRA
mmetsp:Transcript_76754/g.183875  ORF Transcript_76754/g.183875 Transcript_76754/m.183875 type:complete len:291 (+) Transcript_76754:1120-1992(+)